MSKTCTFSNGQQAVTPLALESGQSVTAVNSFLITFWCQLLVLAHIK